MIDLKLEEFTGIELIYECSCVSDEELAKCLEPFSNNTYLLKKEFSLWLENRKVKGMDVFKPYAFKVLVKNKRTGAILREVNVQTEQVESVIDDVFESRLRFISNYIMLHNAAAKK